MVRPSHLISHISAYGAALNFNSVSFQLHENEREYENLQLIKISGKPLTNGLKLDKSRTMNSKPGKIDCKSFSA